MLKTLIVENFQSHKSSEIEFVPGVNLIYGQSQSGKTAILRALNLVVNNKPRGDNFIRHNTKEASVSLIGERDGKVFSVTRTRGDKENCYLIDVGGEESEFRAFGADVPEKVRELLNLTDVNIQDQLSPYFLVLDPPGQIALYIRTIAKLDEIDDIISALSSKIRTTDTDVKGKAEDIEKIDEKLKVLQKINLAKLEENLNVYEGLEDEGEKLNLEVNALSTTLASLKEVEEAVEKINKIDLNHLAIQYCKCVDFSLEKNNIEIEIHSLDLIVRGLEEVEACKIDIPEGILERSTSLSDDWIRLDDEQDTLDTLVRSLNNTLNGISDAVVSLERVESERDKLLALISKCPYCDSVLTDETRDHLIGKRCSTG